MVERLWVEGLNIVEFVYDADVFSEGELCLSEQFPAGGCQWRGKFYPNGTAYARRSKAGYASAFVQLEEVGLREFPINTKFTICFQNYINAQKFGECSRNSDVHAFRSIGEDRGFQFLMKRNMLVSSEEGWIQDGKCKIVIKLEFFKDDCYKMPWTEDVLDLMGLENDNAYINF
jgi:hypothetical protein